jgi:dienelactone hydrolase
MGSKKIIIFLVFFPVLFSGCDLFTRAGIDYPEKGRAVMRTTASYHWWSYVPASAKKGDTCYIWVDMMVPQVEDYDEVTTAAGTRCRNCSFVAELFGYIIIEPAVPRLFSPCDYYPEALDYYSLRSSTPAAYYRPDLKVNAIIDELRSLLSASGCVVPEKVFVSGFSAGGMWSNRYALLNPERVKAAAMGHCGGWLGMPLEQTPAGVDLNWPMGLSDFEALTGSPYDKSDALKAVPQFVFIGAEDTGSAYTGFGCYPGVGDIEAWGTTNQIRLETQTALLASLEYDVTYKVYPGAGHMLTVPMQVDILSFFNSHR